MELKDSAVVEMGETGTYDDGLALLPGKKETDRLASDIRQTEIMEQTKQDIERDIIVEEKPQLRRRSTGRGFSPLVIMPEDRRRRMWREKNYWSQDELRSIFRSLDVNNNNKLSYKEFREGLNMLGFDVSNKIALKALTAQLDRNSDGGIHETEFLKYFRNITRVHLQERLNKRAKEEEEPHLDQTSSTLQKLGLGNPLKHHAHHHAHAVDLRVIDFGWDPGSKAGVFQERKYSHQDLHRIFEETSSVLDSPFVISSSPPTSPTPTSPTPPTPTSTPSVTSRTGTKGFSLHNDWENHITWIDVYGHSRVVLDLLANELNIPESIVDEFRYKQPGKIRFYPRENLLQFVTHVITLSNVPLKQKSNEETELITGRLYSEKPPLLEACQMMFLLIGDHTIMSIRRRSHAASVGSIFDDLLEEIKRFCKESRSKYQFPNTKAVLTSLLHEVLDHNWRVRDRFKDWKIVLEEAVRRNVEQDHARHILDLDTVSLAAVKAVEPFVRSLEVLSEVETDFSTASTPSSSSSSSSSSSTASSSSSTSSKSGSSLAPVRLSHLLLAQQFIGDEIGLLRDLSHAYKKLYSNLVLTREICDKLNEYFQHASDNRMTNTLRVLTMVTTTIAPTQLLAGIYGMNFHYMPDLDFKYSYMIFWIFNILLIIIILRYFHYRGFF